MPSALKELGNQFDRKERELQRGLESDVVLSLVAVKDATERDNGQFCLIGRVKSVKVFLEGRKSLNRRRFCEGTGYLLRKLPVALILILGGSHNGSSCQEGRKTLIRLAKLLIAETTVTP